MEKAQNGYEPRTRIQYFEPADGVAASSSTEETAEESVWGDEDDSGETEAEVAETEEVEEEATVTPIKKAAPAKPVARKPLAKAGGRKR